MMSGLRKPDKEKPSVDEKTILLKGDMLAKKIDHLINDKSKDYKMLIKKIEELLKKIKTFRQSGLEKWW